MKTINEMLKILAIMILLIMGFVGVLAVCAPQGYTSSGVD